MSQPACANTFMTNNAIVLAAFDQLGGSVNHVQALIAAVRRTSPMADELARQLIDRAIKDGVLTIDSIGEVRKA